MAASRKLYVDIAESFKIVLAATATNTAKFAVARAANYVATDLKRDNPRFSMDRFFEACGLAATGNLKDE